MRLHDDLFIHLCSLRKVVASAPGISKPSLLVVWTRKIWNSIEMIILNTVSVKIKFTFQTTNQHQIISSCFIVLPWKISHLISSAIRGFIHLLQASLDANRGSRPWKPTSFRSMFCPKITFMDKRIKQHGAAQIWCLDVFFLHGTYRLTGYLLLSWSHAGEIVSINSPQA